MMPTPSELALRVRAFLHTHGVVHRRVGLAVSGGLDSMCLAHLLLEIGYRPAIVHVNHQLRGEESEGDEAFVRAFAEQHRLPFHSTRVDVRTHAERYGLSTQVAARQLRYAFFDELLVQVGRQTPTAAALGLEFLFTAHHADDQVETLLLSLLRGKEWNILGGIPAVRGSYLRPLLTTTRAELEAYQQSNGIAYREDRSNTDEAYLRNKIRHTVLPVLREINPNLTAHLGEQLALYEYQLAALTHYVDSNEGFILWPQLNGDMVIDFETRPQNEYEPYTDFIALVAKLPAPFYGHPERVKQLVQLKEMQVGKRMDFPGWTAIREREGILLQALHPPEQFPPTFLPSSDELRLPMGQLHIAFSQQPVENPIPAQLEQLDQASLVAFTPLSLRSRIENDFAPLPPPGVCLHLRPWRDGDRYQPLGMTGTQNVSDILTDKKVPTHLRRTYWVLEDAEGIVLLQGHRPAERVKLTEATKRVVSVRWQPHAG